MNREYLLFAMITSLLSLLSVSVPAAGGALRGGGGPGESGRDHL